MHVHIWISYHNSSTLSCVFFSCRRNNSRWLRTLSYILFLVSFVIQITLTVSLSQMTTTSQRKIFFYLVRPSLVPASLYSVFRSPWSSLVPLFSSFLCVSRVSQMCGRGYVSGFFVLGAQASTEGTCSF